MDKNKTIEQIEDHIWPTPGMASHLVMTIHNLRKKPLKDFTIEDLRIVIAQSFSLDILIPVAIEKLKENIIAEGDFYQGDLLKAVLDSDAEYWRNERDNWKSIVGLFTDNRNRINDKTLLNSFANFLIN